MEDSELNIIFRTYYSKNPNFKREEVKQMLKKTGLLVTLLLCLSVMQAADAKINVGLDLGYQMIGMGDINEFVDFMASMISAGSGQTATVSKLSNATAMGIKGSYDLNEKISLGLKVGTLSTNKAKVEVMAMEALSASASLMPILIGGAYKFMSKDKISLSGELYLGTVSSEEKFTFMTGPSTTAEMQTSGSGTSIDIGVAGEYSVAKNITLGASLGYKMCTISELKVKADVDMNGDGNTDVVAGEVVKKMSDPSQNMKADFTGVNLQLSVNYKF